MQKRTITGFVFVTLLFLLFVSVPSPTAAEEPNVIDWLEEEQTESQTVEKENETNIERMDAQDKSPMLLIGQLFFYTLLIVVLVYGLIKFLASRQKKLQPNQNIQLIGGTGLGNNKSLQLVKVAGKVYLLGVADQITLIKEFAGDEEIGSFDEDKKKSSTFAGSLLGLAKKQDENRPKGFEQFFDQSLNKQRDKQRQLERELFEDDQEGRER